MSGAAAKRTRTLCPYCGVGCGLVVDHEGDRVVSVSGDVSYPVNRGRTCAKPVALPEAVRASDRATMPLLRERRDGPRREAGWEQAIGTVAARLAAIRAEHGPEAIAFYISGQLLTEDYYAVNKLAKGFIGTNNVDSNSRLCMSSAVAGYDASFGSDGPPAAYADIEAASCFFLLGSNTAACHPIIWARIRDRQSTGAEVIVVDPRLTETARAADLHLQVKPGTDLALLNAMLHVIEREGMLDRRFIDDHTEGFVDTLAVAAEWTPQRAGEVCGIGADQIVAAAKMFAGSAGSLAMWSMGANQSSVGTLKNRAIHNLCLASGQIARVGAGPFSLTGQPNAMGGRETGGLAHLLPGYRKVANPDDRAAIEAHWGCAEAGTAIAPAPGHCATDLFEALADGRVKAVWICATNPAVSFPDSARAIEALGAAELVICQDAYHPTETSALADIFLPAAGWPEKEGTMTNSERRVGLVQKVCEPPGEALADWEIFARVGRAMGWEKQFGWADAAAVYDEFAACTAGRVCDVSGLSHRRLREQGSIQWPCPAEQAAVRRGREETAGTARLYLDRRFPTPNGRARFAVTEHAEPAEMPDPEFPLTLTSGRVAGQWHTMTRTGKSRKLLAADPEPFCEIHPIDGRRGGVRDGALLRIVSRRGSAIVKARFDATIGQGVAFAPFHWGALHTDPGAGTLNQTTIAAIDPISRQPELKACAVRVEPVGAPLARRASADTAGSAAAKSLVVVGTGMAGLAVVEAVRERADRSAWEITMLGREPEPPYNRIMLSRLLTREQPPAIELQTPSWYRRNAIDLRTGVEVKGVDTAAKTVALDDGSTVSYDALVIATGSQPAAPPIPGIDLPGVVAFRTAADAADILRRAAAVSHGRAVVIGGGLLGLEAARGLIDLGRPTTVVHLLDRLMETQLDPAAARLVARRIRELGAEIRFEHLTEEIYGDGKVEGVRFRDGTEIETDLIVVATGIRPDVELARAAGLEVERGIVVDDELRSSAASVWAVGECAQHRGNVYGLWAPLQEQAKVAGATIAGDPAAFNATLPATTLKVMGVDLYCAGRPAANDDDEDEIVIADGRSGAYRKIVIRDGRMVGAILLGDLSASRRLSELARSGDQIPDDLMGALVAGLATGPPCDADGSELVCSCNAVDAATIQKAIREGALTKLEQVMVATKAATGCGGCSSDVEALLAEAESERRAEFRALARGR